MTLTRVFNPAIMTWAAMWAIAFSVVGKLGAVLQTIPTPVMGGILVLYQGALIMTHRDGFPRFSARSTWRGGAEIPIGDFALGGIGLAGVVGVLLNLVLPRGETQAAD